ncbi:unnamed protein product [Porites evermanni]|uniref:Hyccin n=1 Tax=Porites evermanni TaxID=104178 RepID=A0ABN8SIL3_9CNID|nr:unnamed protein product [Porites evermanni]
MDLKTVKEVLESCCKSESPTNIQKLKNDKNLINGIIQNLPEHYAHQLSDPVFKSLFELFRQSGKGEQLFVLQFVPVLIWTYLSASTRRDEKAYGNLEALLLAIYNEMVEIEEQKTKTFRLPSLSRPSIYHEPYQGLTTSSTLTETALSRHEQSEMVVTSPGPGRPLNKITGMHRLSVLSAILYQYNANIVYMTEASHHSFCIMALRLAKSGFYKLCQRCKEESESYFSTEEVTKLVNHPRITLSTELIQEITHGLYFLMYNGQRVIATKALEDLHWRAAHSLLAPAHMLTSAIKHSLEETGGLPRDGPLGLEIYLSDTQENQANSGKAVPSVGLPSMDAPDLYFSDEESYVSCLENVVDDDNDNDNGDYDYYDDDAGGVFTDTAGSLDGKTKKYLTTCNSRICEKEPRHNETSLLRSQFASPLALHYIEVPLCGTVIPANTGKILALSTSGLKRSSHVSMEYPIVDTEEVEIEVETRKWSSSSDQAANEARKSHKKSHSLGYFKRPGFLSTKDVYLELG